ncbi:hypothetical protein EJ05DRAFT_515666 [Pseudovirgaria hyperparasitica]|uniref:Uncharacterized protein n=1 Tax=Pseudovirgaria hyperparasitica TaxID=470096 RepID=A0A6A6VT37_9PEZI|nr:uncharacterized protein EJ05DRAFT_515666 [Pseudovirgaria hyperparasitica]KAF2752407.1 hypothetical protein EJ05DRAFT_515666 [Pseudovirgaria hyperparasitica]
MSAKVLDGRRLTLFRKCYQLQAQFPGMEIDCRVAYNDVIHVYRHDKEASWPTQDENPTRVYLPCDFQTVRESQSVGVIGGFDPANRSSLNDRSLEATPDLVYDPYASPSGKQSSPVASIEGLGADENRTIQQSGSNFSLQNRGDNDGLLFPLSSLNNNSPDIDYFISLPMQTLSDQDFLAECRHQTAENAYVAHNHGIDVLRPPKRRPIPVRSPHGYLHKRRRLGHDS